MEIPKGGAQRMRIGAWSLDPARNELSRDGRAARLEPKAIEVLVYLARKAGDVVAREELLSAVWPGVIVGDDALTQAIIKLRKALGDDAHRPTYIETISKRGYRLIAPVVGQDSPVVAAASAPRPRGKRLLIGALVTGFALPVLIGVLKSSPDLAARFGIGWPIVSHERAEAFAVSPPLIAVVPLANQSGDARRDYFSDGVTDDIIQALGRFSGVRVISRSSVEAFKGGAASAQQIKGELGARYVVRGSVREIGGKLRVAMELSDAERGIVLWSERYENESREVFEVQDRVVRNIVGALAVKVTRLEEARALSRPTETLEAYDLVLRARALLAKSERVANRQARELLAQARGLAPDYADAYVASGIAEVARSIYGWMEDPSEGLALAEQYLQRAIALGDAGATARAYGALAHVYSTQGKLDETLAAADRAIELNPSDALVYDYRGAALLYLGRVEEAITSTETGLRLNPAGHSAATGFHAALAHYMLGRYAPALARVDAALARYPDLPFLHALRAATLAQMGRDEEARKAAADLRRLEPFFRTSEFGSRFVNPANAARLQEGLRKAGI